MRSHGSYALDHPEQIQSDRRCLPASASPRGSPPCPRLHIKQTSPSVKSSRLLCRSHRNGIFNELCDALNSSPETNAKTALRYVLAHGQVRTCSSSNATQSSLQGAKNSQAEEEGEGATHLLSLRLCDWQHCAGLQHAAAGAPQC